MIWSVQVLRFFAALMIVYVHAHFIAGAVTGSSGILPAKLADTAMAGVDIFFVISGVIIARIAPGRTPSDFILSRIKRIVPMYFLFTLPSVAIEVGTKSFGWRDAISSFLFFPATNIMTVPALQVGWTLCFEILFYSCATLVLINRRWTILLLCLYASAMALRSFGPPLQFIGNPIILEFLFGVAIAYAPNLRFGIIFLPLGVISLLSVGLIGVIPSGNPGDALSGQDGLLRTLVFGIPAAMIVYGALQYNTKPSKLTYLGDASYSLYLSHVYIVFPAYFLWRSLPLPTDAIIIISVLAALVFGWRIYERVEKPIIALLNRKK